MLEVDTMGNIIPNKVTQDENDDMVKEEAVRYGKNRKSPGNDGICQEFYKVSLATIKSELLEVIRWMHSKGDITQQQKHGIIVCIPKTLHPECLEDYRPLTLPPGEDPVAVK
jgi:hypothetical protein